MESQLEKKLMSKEIRETREKENEAGNELKAGAAMERADMIVKEVKQSKKQMQNIVLHMQTVLQAIRQLRRQLQLVQNNDDPASVRQDRSRIDELKKKIREYGDEMEKMKEDLIREQCEELSRNEREHAVAGKIGIGIGLSGEELRKKAEAMVEKMIEEVKSS